VRQFPIARISSDDVFNTKSIVIPFHRITAPAFAVVCLFAGFAEAQDSPAPVVVGRAELAPVADRLVLSGSATARRVSLISPLSDGLVAAMLVDVGDRVEAGQVMARMDAVIAQHELATAEAELAEGLAQLRDAERRRDEAAEVHAEALIADTVYESALAEVEIRAAAVQRLRAEYERRREIFARHTVRAPFAGVVARKLAESGQWVQRSEALFELVDSEVLRVDVAVPQNRFAEVVAGTPVTVRFDALPSIAVETFVATRLAVGDPAARTFLARIEIANPEQTFAPGMSARVTLNAGDVERGAVLNVPRDALVRLEDGAYRIWRIREEASGTTVESLPVEVWRFTGDVAVIAPGAVSPGDRVVVRGNERLRPDQAVRIVESRS
jgi:RND family efflux transporter MFP subunit